MASGQDSIHTDVIVFEMLEYVVGKNISKHMQTLCTLSPLLDVVQI